MNKIETDKEREREAQWESGWEIEEDKNREREREWQAHRDRNNEKDKHAEIMRKKEARTPR